MPTYIYSPSKKNNQSARSNVSSPSNYKKTPTPKRKSPNVNLLKLYQQPQNTNNNTKTLRYKTTAPTFVNKRYIQRPNGGYTLEYNIKNAKIVTNQKPKLRFIQIAKLVSPRSLK